MPNIKSAKKRMRSSERARVRNLAFRTRVKTCRKEFLDAIDGGDEKVSSKAFSTYCSVLDKAAKQGVINKNTAVRRKSRAAEKLRVAAK